VSVLLLESLHPEAEALLAAAGEVTRAADPNAPGAAVPYARVQGILTRGRGRIDAALMARCPQLKVVARSGVGVDNVDLEAARARGIPVLYAPGGNTATTAEHAIALLLAFTRRVPQTARAVAEGRWEERGSYAGDEACGKTLGIVGYGAIGKRVARIAVALGMEVIVAERTGLSCEHATLPLPELLRRADFVSLHLPLTEATRGLIGAAELALMKPGACLINTARGSLVDQKALTAALASGRLGGFAADVLDPEPPAPHDPILRSDRVLITPHVASLTASTYRELCLLTACNVLAVLRGETVEPRFVRD
jgi:phosphoglycerate dehydrogenase-like enzyme